MNSLCNKLGLPSLHTSDCSTITDSPAHSFRARRALCGAAWQRSAVFLRLQAAFRAPPKTIVPIVYLPFGESLQAACVCLFYRRRATEEAATERYFSLYGFHSVSPRPAEAGIWCCQGQGSGRRKNAKIRRSVEDFLKIKMQG